MINDNQNETKNGKQIHRYKLNRPRPIDMETNILNIKFISIMLAIRIKQHLSNILKACILIN